MLRHQERTSVERWLEEPADGRWLGAHTAGFGPSVCFDITAAVARRGEVGICCARLTRQRFVVEQMCHRAHGCYIMCRRRRGRRPLL